MNNIKAARKAAKMTQQQAAEALHVSQSGYWAWENGKANISGASLIDMARLFNVSLDFLLGTTDKPTDDLQSSEKPTVKDDGLTLDLSGLTEENRQRVAGFVAALSMTQDK